MVAVQKKVKKPFAVPSNPENKIVKKSKNPVDKGEVVCYDMQVCETHSSRVSTLTLWQSGLQASNIFLNMRDLCAN